MNNYRVVESGEIINEDEFRARHPNTSFPPVISAEIQEQYGVAAILQGPQPTPGPWQDVVCTGVDKDSAGNWMYMYALEDWSAERQQAALASSRAAAWEQIKQIRDDHSLNGGLDIDGSWFQTDVLSRGRYFMLKDRAAHLRAEGASGSTVIQLNGNLSMWKCMDNSFVPVTIDLIDRIMNGLVDREALIFCNAEALKAAVESSPNPAAFDINSGWPARYSAA